MIYRSLHAIFLSGDFILLFLSPKEIFFIVHFIAHGDKKGAQFCPSRRHLLFGNVPNKARFMWAKKLPKSHPVREKSRILYAKNPL